MCLDLGYFGRRCLGRCLGRHLGKCFGMCFGRRLLLIEAEECLIDWNIELAIANSLGCGLSRLGSIMGLMPLAYRV